jgi:hypothetical protein
LSDPAPPIPADIEALAAARAQARTERDYGRADQLKAEIEAAGWRVVDVGTRYTVAPARPPDRHEDGRVVYGSAASVPTRLEEPAVPGATVVIVASDPEASVASAAAARSQLGDADIVLVAADGVVARGDVLERMRLAIGVLPVEVDDPGSEPGGVEIVWTTDSLGPAASLVAGIRRVDREIVIALEAGAIPEGDLGTPIAEALRDPAVAAVGAEGLASADLHRFVPARPEDPVVVLGPSLLAFRRVDADRLAALDERLGGYTAVIAWSSLALRESMGDAGTRRVIALDLPLRDRDAPSEVERRDRYRISGRFGDDAELRA